VATTSSGPSRRERAPAASNERLRSLAEWGEEVDRASGQRAVSSPLRPAAEIMAEALAGSALQPPAVRSSPMYRRPDARSATITGGLVEQVTLWCGGARACSILKQAGVEEVVEIGTGRVLTGLAKRIDPDLSAQRRRNAGKIESLIKEF